MKFFHASTNARKKFNSISSLTRKAGFVANDHNGICDVVSYFQTCLKLRIIVMILALLSIKFLSLFPPMKMSPFWLLLLLMNLKMSFFKWTRVNLLALMVQTLLFQKKNAFCVDLNFSTLVLHGLKREIFLLR